MVQFSVAIFTTNLSYSPAVCIATSQISYINTWTESGHFKNKHGFGRRFAIYGHISCIFMTCLLWEENLSFASAAISQHFLSRLCIYCKVNNYRFREHITRCCDQLTETHGRAEPKDISQRSHVSSCSCWWGSYSSRRWCCRWSRPSKLKEVKKITQVSLFL